MEKRFKLIVGRFYELNGNILKYIGSEEGGVFLFENIETGVVKKYSQANVSHMRPM